MIFRNEVTSEFLHYLVSFRVIPSGVIRTIEMVSPVRQSTSSSVKVENPLPYSVTFAVECRVPDINLPSQFVVPANSEVRPAAGAQIAVPAVPEALPLGLQIPVCIPETGPAPAVVCDVLPKDPVPTFRFREIPDLEIPGVGEVRVQGRKSGPVWTGVPWALDQWEHSLLMRHFCVQSTLRSLGGRGQAGPSASREASVSPCRAHSPLNSSPCELEKPSGD